MTTEKTNAYYDAEDLNRFAEMGQCASPLWEKFSAYYGAVFEEGELTKREKALIALAVAHTVQYPYCIDAYTKSYLENPTSIRGKFRQTLSACRGRRGNCSLTRHS